jgi:hypothetical protein
MMIIEIPPAVLQAHEHEERLRFVRIAPYREGAGPRFYLSTWDTNTTDNGSHNVIGHRLTDETGTTIFTGECMGVSPMTAIDSDEALRSVITFLSLRPGDTDEEYFADYTDEQMSFAESHGEYVGLYADNENPEPFENLDGWPHE